MTMRGVTEPHATRKEEKQTPNAPNQICNSISDAQCKDDDKHDMTVVKKRKENDSAGNECKFQQDRRGTKVKTRDRGP
jgi:hypothetical protein